MTITSRVFACVLLIPAVGCGDEGAPGDQGTGAAANSSTSTSASGSGSTNTTGASSGVGVGGAGGGVTVGAGGGAEPAYEADFETGDTSQLDGVNDCEIVPSDLPGGGAHALRCRLPAGASQSYVGFGLDAQHLPDRSDVYIRYFVKFEPSWRFATDDGHFKSLVIECEGTTPSNGRTFVNFQSLDADTAALEALVYTDAPQAPPFGTQVVAMHDGAWHRIDVHSRRDLANPSQGTFTVHHDGVLVIDESPTRAGNALASWFTFGYRNGTAQQEMFMQYDEVALSNAPIGGL